MDSSHALLQTQTQQLKLHKHQILKLEVLRMPLFELSRHIQEQLLENPVLELEDSELPTEPLNAQQVIEAEQYSDVKAGVASIDYYLDSGRHYSYAAEDLSANISTGKQTFADMLMEQLALLDLDEADYSICSFLVQCLDRRGYLKDDPGELADILNVDEEEILGAIYTLQALKPAGVAARTLQECLILQLFEIGQLDRRTIMLVREGLGLLAQNNVAAIALLLGVDKPDAAEYCNLIRGLNPIPSAGYNTGEQSASIIPDAAVGKMPEGFSISLTSGYADTLKLNREYMDMLKNPELGGYLGERAGKAKLLITAVKEREFTLTRILQCVVERQPEYFDKGRGLQPMTMQSVAEELELHVSTISRAVQDKYIECVAGTVLLKSLFSQGVDAEGGQAVSQAYIKEKIKACVASEDKAAPLSDEDIRAALKLMNIDISRRTVAKYREAMGIPSSRLRKRYE